MFSEARAGKPFWLKHGEIIGQVCPRSPPKAGWRTSKYLGSMLRSERHVAYLRIGGASSDPWGSMEIFAASSETSTMPAWYTGEEIGGPSVPKIQLWAL